MIELIQSQAVMSNHQMSSTIRIIDANANRAAEALRVVEDYLRFHQNDAHLSRITKEIRHQLSQTLAAHFPDRQLCRSTSTDVGTNNQTLAEYQRASLAHIVIANMRRCTEALRTLEEYSKLVDSTPAREFESLRYRAYTLEKCLGHLERGTAALQNARLYVLIDLRYGFETEYVDRLRQMLDAGVHVVQLRDKQASDRELIHAGKITKSVLASFKEALTPEAQRPLLIMNDRPDLACIVEADGVHVGQEEVSVTEARSVVGPDRLVGVSTHSVQQARAAVDGGADYIGVGPVFPSRTKQFEEFVGTELVHEVSSTTSLPSFAIGGITSDTLPVVLESGAKRVAVSNAIWGADCVTDAVERFNSQWKTRIS